MNEENKIPNIIMVADDDADDRLLIQEAWKQSEIMSILKFTVNGEDLMDYLLHRGKYSAEESSPRPGIILLDLNMPKKDGREALKEIKLHSELRRIPIVVLTTSKAEEDIFKTYDLGVNSFITKPVTFDALIKITNDLAHYWFETVKLPEKK